MGAKKIKDFYKSRDRKGISFSPYFHSAVRFYEYVLQAEKELKTKEDEIREELSGYSIDRAEVIIFSETRKELSRLDDFSKATQIFCCMAIESFLNLYGVNYLGEDFYKRNLEKLSAGQKLEALIAISTHLALEKDDEICKIVRRMFDQRNRLVHPKAKQILADSERLELVVSSDDPVVDAKKMIDDMKLFFNLFREADPSLSSLIDYLIKEENFY